MTWNIAGNDNLGYVVSADYTATVSDTSDISAVFTATMPTNLIRVIMIPQGDMYYKIGGVASDTTAKLTSTLALNMPTTKTLADTIQVYAAGVVCDLLVCTPR